jgi:site-specific DNA-methyltransferase (adenine-specific)
MNLYNDDCFNVFPKIEDKSIDLFVLDLPYANKKFGNCLACKWDTPIDLKEMWQHIKRIMKPNAIIVHFCNTKFGYSLIESNPKWFRYDLIWKKSRKVGFLSANKMPLRQHENIYVFKDNQGTYNPQKTEGKKNHSQGKGKNSSINPQEPKLYGKTNGLKNETELTTQKHPTSIIDNTILEYKNPHKTIHRTQKPVDLLEWLIKTYSNENDTVMDFCMGSGTAGIACKNLKRKFIGVEKEKEIFEKAKKRIEES